MHRKVERRGVALAAVQTVPGSHLRALQRISGLPLGTLRYHLRLLVDQCQVEMERDRRFRRFYPVAMESEARRVWDALRQRQTRALVALLLEAPARQSDLARRLGLANTTVHTYAHRLMALEIVEERGGRLALRSPAVVAAILDSVNPTAWDLLMDGAIGLFDQLDN
jgi:predicted transcriptional regulator